VDTRLHLLLLSALVAVGAVAAPSGCALAQAAADATGAPAQNPQVVEPQVQRRTVKPPAIGTDNFEAGLFLGTISIEDFGSSFLYGGRLAYHFTEDVFAEATLGSSKAGLTSYEQLSGSARLLTDSQRQFTYYDASIGWNALPGEVFFGRKRAMPSAIYFTLGGGDTHFAGNDHFTVALGTGLRLLATDWLAVHLNARDLIFDSDVLGRNKRTENLQFTLSVTAFF